MKKLTLIAAALLFIISACSDLTKSNLDTPAGTTSGSGNPVQAVPGQAASSTTTSQAGGQWVTAYLASYNNYVLPTGNWGDLPTDAIDWSAFTQMDYFALNAKSDGSLSTIAAYQNFSPDRLTSIVTAAHTAGKPILFTVGGWGNHDAFASAISSSNRTAFINNLISVMTKWNFDGIDIDMEPINSGDVSNYTAFIKQLYNALQQHKTPVLSKPMLTCATSWQPAMFAQLQSYFDEINLMTYDMSGAWQGWVTWHNAPVYDGSITFPGSSKKVPSIDDDINSYTAAGVDAKKLGIGIDFYGYVWSGGTGTSTGGVTAPDQSWQTAPTVTDNVAYHDIMDQYYQSGNVKWDSKADAAYISIDQSGSANDKFISYDNEKSIQAKFQYMRDKGIGGVIIWELGAGYRSNQPAGQRDLLLQAVKQAMNNTTSSSSTTPTLDTTPPTVSISSPASGSTVSGTANVQIQASDNIGVSLVQLSVDGTTIGSSLTIAPFTFSWNTGGLADGTHTLQATALDAAGNKSTTSETVTVSNTTTSGGSTTGSVSGSKTQVYDDALSSPWTNASWSSTVDLSNTQYTYSGSNAIKVAQNAWGAFSIHSGSWSSPVNIDASAQNLTFAVYSPGSPLDLSVRLENTA
ncbi:MAG TPA: glycosyl hydrolase family 18 protein, partial [Balneolales bacterium]|nr:glycosyl hydrolase family 18 protein [Balneolales bacterium]